MKGATKFLLDVSIMSPDFTERKEIKLQAGLVKSDSGYGNDTYMIIKSRDGGNFEQYIDIRYDTTFNKDKPELYIINWVYNYWSGDNGSWNVVACSIKVSGVKTRLKTLDNIR